jgi:hypothetical protein
MILQLVTTQLILFGTTNSKNIPSLSGDYKCPEESKGHPPKRDLARDTGYECMPMISLFSKKVR